MTMPVISNFNEAAISTIFDKIVSHAATLGYFDSVLGHEPKNAPGTVCPRQCGCSRSGRTGLAWR